MKIRILLIALLAMLCAAPQVEAQSHYKPHISIGGRAGVSLSEMSFSPSVKQSWLMGTAGAVTFRYSEERLFGVIVEFGWSQRGWKENYEEAPLSYSRSLTYLRLPILTQIIFGSRRFKTFINLGPEFGYMLGSSISSDFDYKNPLTVPQFPSNRMTEQLYAPISGKFDYGIEAGIGFEFYVQPRHSILLEGRFYYGLGNIFPSSKADTFGASRNMSIEVTLGYNFRLI